MNAPLDNRNVSQAASTGTVASLQAALDKSSSGDSQGVERTPATDDKICWVEVRQSPYLPDQQVELLHLQAEAEALLLQLQAAHQKRQGQATALAR
jgi:hypothetical protein